MLKVAVIDESPAVSGDFRALLDVVEGVQVVGTADNVSDAVYLIEATGPDVVVLDIDLRDGERGMTVLQFLRREHPAVRVVTLSNYGWHAMRLGFIAAGASAYFARATERLAARDWIARLSAAAGLAEPRAALA